MGDRLTQQECLIIIKQNEEFGLAFEKVKTGIEFYRLGCAQTAYL